MRYVVQRCPAQHATHVPDGTSIGPTTVNAIPHKGKATLSTNSNQIPHPTQAMSTVSRKATQINYPPAQPQQCPQKAGVNKVGNIGYQLGPGSGNKPVPDPPEPSYGALPAMT